MSMPYDVVKYFGGKSAKSKGHKSGKGYGYGYGGHAKSGESYCGQWAMPRCCISFFHSSNESVFSASIGKGHGYGYGGWSNKSGKGHGYGYGKSTYDGHYAKSSKHYCSLGAMPRCYVSIFIRLTNPSPAHRQGPRLRRLL